MRQKNEMNHALGRIFKLFKKFWNLTKSIINSNTEEGFRGSWLFSYLIRFIKFPIVLSPINLCSFVPISAMNSGHQNLVR